MRSKNFLHPTVKQSVLIFANNCLANITSSSHYITQRHLAY